MQCTPKSNKEMEEAHAQPRKKSYKFLSKYVHLFKQYFLKEQILTGKEGMNSHQGPDMPPDSLQAHLFYCQACIATHLLAVRCCPAAPLTTSFAGAVLFCFRFALTTFSSSSTAFSHFSCLKAGQLEACLNVSSEKKKDVHCFVATKLNDISISWWNKEFRFNDSR